MGGPTVEGDTEMAKTVYFVQECPTCGRALHVRVEYLGKRLVCEHCGGALIASDPEGSPSHASRLLDRADALCNRCRAAHGLRLIACAPFEEPPSKRRG